MCNCGKTCGLLLFTLLALLSFACLYIEFWQGELASCETPFVEIGSSCYFFSTNKAPTYEYYKVAYKGRIFSVPAQLDWLAAGFACETLDQRAHLISVESFEENQQLVIFMQEHAHSAMHTYFWSAGHRGSMLDGFAPHTLQHHYWHRAAEPMNYTNFAVNNSQRFSLGHCLYLELIDWQIVMTEASCKSKMSYACEFKL
ncbi:uncharacterized protein LOC108604231 [Drosophila busckii]|uniref:uncharacterized protein LOC108604231 n=1 Tax=Drosophila busckii TaxID=30019 RepID=UPI001432C0DE|nr:uncharacterized protein LOC108604231 [Drosophila busckii]